MDEQQFLLILKTIESVDKNVDNVKSDLKDFKNETKQAIANLSDRLTVVENHLNSKSYFWNTIGITVAGFASCCVVLTVILKLFNVF